MSSDDINFCFSNDNIQIGENMAKFDRGRSYHTF